MGLTGRPCTIRSRACSSLRSGFVRVMTSLEVHSPQPPSTQSPHHLAPHHLPPTPNTHHQARKQAALDAKAKQRREKAAKGKAELQGSIDASKKLIDAAKKLDDEVRAAFQKCDVNGNGVIEMSEVEPLMKSLGLLKGLRSHRHEFMQRCFDKHDKNSDGTLR